MLHVFNKPSQSVTRQRGLAPLLLVGGLAVAGTGGTLFWHFSGWRVEQTANGRVCGIEKDLWQWSGLPLKNVDTERQACEALADQPRTTCPLIAPTAIGRCSPILGNERLARPAFIAPLNRVPEVRETGPFAIGRARASAVATWMRQSGDILVFPAPAKAAVKTDAAVYFLKSSNDSKECLGVGIGTANTILTAAHCLAGAEKKLFEASCLDGIGSVTYSCERIHPATNTKSSTSSCKPEFNLDIARCVPSPAATPPGCFHANGETVEWSGHPVPVLPRVWVTGLVGARAKILPVDVVAGRWPEEADGKSVVCTASESEFTQGDSGGPVFNQERGKDQKVVGINNCSPSACIVPLYLWKAELAATK